MSDKVNNPKHYNSSPSGIEAIKVIRHLPGNLFAAMKYIWRLGLKDDPVVELKKAIWHLADQIDLIEGKSDQPDAWGEQLKSAMKFISSKKKK